MSIDADPFLGLLTIADVAELLKVSVSTVRRLQQQRTIPFIKVGGRIRFTRNDIASYLETNRVRSIDE
jgi:excisionase family DNA binding protein